MDIDFLYNDEVLAKIMGKDALRVKELLQGINAKGSNDLIEKMLLIIALQAAGAHLPQLSRDTVSEYKAIIDLKKIGLASCSRIYKQEFIPSQKSIPTLDDFED